MLIPSSVVRALILKSDIFVTGCLDHKIIPVHWNYLFTLKMNPKVLLHSWIGRGIGVFMSLKLLRGEQEINGEFITLSPHA